MNNISTNELKKENILQINEYKLIKQDEEGILTASYIRYATKKEIDFIHLIPLAIELLEAEKTSS